MDLPDALDARSYFGPSLPSYRFDGRTFALPVDASTIHSVWNPRKVGLAGNIPQSWGEVREYALEARRLGQPILLAAKGHHALLTIFSLAANLGADTDDGVLHWPIRQDTLAEAIAAFIGVLDLTNRELSLASDAIDVHEQLAAPQGPGYCPAAYGYAVYDQFGDLRFGDFPGVAAPYWCGSIVGGAGIAVRRSSSQLESTIAFLRFLADPITQFILADNEGQPALRQSYANVRYFPAIENSLSGSIIRPRLPGYVELERSLSQLLHQGLFESARPRLIAERLAALA